MKELLYFSSSFSSCRIFSIRQNCEWPADENERGQTLAGNKQTNKQTELVPTVVLKALVETENIAITAASPHPRFHGLLIFLFGFFLKFN